jgi:hypothetical protein
VNARPVTCIGSTADTLLTSTATWPIYDSASAPALQHSGLTINIDTQYHIINNTKLHYTTMASTPPPMDEKSTTMPATASDHKIEMHPGQHTVIIPDGATGLLINPSGQPIFVGNPTTLPFLSMRSASAYEKSTTMTATGGDHKEYVINMLDDAATVLPECDVAHVPKWQLAVALALVCVCIGLLSGVLVLLVSVGRLFGPLWEFEYLLTLDAGLVGVGRA